MALSKHVIDSLFEEEEMLLAAAAYVQLQIIKKSNQPKKKNSVWVRSWLQRRVFWAV
jgi:hypothetical protein